ncbi:hypothetical protein CAEBREN_04222 [Caenorhabditis brenneri]|uniref:Uncharacterized protein n=1 Tax=Caenorhabditis brenneri TaxID=135651 RepID=G0PCW0_CAEBE|nr:hypothetical protein CAEBREN_04222 [Caenorhabditis brenneri]
MNPPTLFVITARKVAEYILEGKYKGVDYELCNTGSNIIFDIVKEKKHNLETDEQEEIAEEILLKMVKPSRMNFDNKRSYKMREWDLEMLREQNLVELKMGDMRELRGYVKEWDDETIKRLRKIQPVTARDYFDIVDLLNQNLKLETKTSLTNLDISKSPFCRRDNLFPNNWTHALAQMLPNLRILKISGQNLPSSEFQVLCENFPNLTSLDISSTGLVELTGIANLQRLEELAMGGLPIARTRFMNELYELNNLKKLDLNEHHCRDKGSTAMEFFARSENAIPGLLEFDCSKSQITQEQLDYIVDRHSTLKKIIANGVDGLELDYEGIEVLSDDSIDSLLRSIDYFYAKGNHCRNNKNLFYIARKINAREPTIEILRSVIRKVYQLIPIYGYHEEIMSNIGRVCHEATRPALLPLYDNSDKRILMEMFLIFNVKTENPHLVAWKRFNEIIRATEDPQTDKIVSRAIDFFVTFDEEEFSRECLEVMDQLKEKIDMKAEEYKGLDMRKLIVKLKKIQTTKKGKKDVRQKAGRVMRFFEQFA